jgi:acetylserotonin N-methyltransferase
MGPPDPAPVLDLMEAFRRSKCLFAGVSLGLFDLLHDAPQSPLALAETCGCAREPLARLLDGLCALGLLERQDGLYRNLPVASAFLRRASSQTLAGYIQYADQALYPMWGHLEDALREAAPRWRQTFGRDAALFEHFFRTPEARAGFIQGMHGLGLLSSPAVVRAFDLREFRHCADLGGATGHLAAAACEHYGEMRATLFEMPEVVELARPYLARSPAASRIECVTGDFFRDPLPKADLYALGRILHDWREDKIALLLDRIHAALPSGGGLLLAERLLDEDPPGPVSVLMQSLNMLVCTEGRERTLAEYRTLLEAAGFSPVEGRRTGAPLDAILARRK